MINIIIIIIINLGLYAFYIIAARWGYVGLQLICSLVRNRRQENQLDTVLWTKWQWQHFRMQVFRTTKEPTCRTAFSFSCGRLTRWPSGTCRLCSTAISNVETFISEAGSASEIVATWVNSKLSREYLFCPTACDIKTLNKIERQLLTVMGNS